jgi:hypothetical protein
LLRYYIHNITSPLFQFSLFFLPQYLVTPGLDLDFRIFGRVAAKGDDLVVRVSTQDLAAGGGDTTTTMGKGAKSAGAKGGVGAKGGAAKAAAAMSVHLCYPLRDLVEDSKVVEKALQKAMETTPGAAANNTSNSSPASTKRP